MFNNSQITERIKKLILTNKKSDYYVWKNANIPKSSFSKMINNISEWKLKHVVSVVMLFSVEIESVLFGKENYVHSKLLKEYKELKEKVMMLREKVATYEIAAKKASGIKVKQKSK